MRRRMTYLTPLTFLTLAILLAISASGGDEEKAATPPTGGEEQVVPDAEAE